MTMAHKATTNSRSDSSCCPHCDTVLPLDATFCTFCGERINKKAPVALMQNEVDVAERYRIVSLIRRRPYVTLFFAADYKQNRPVAIRDIDTSSLDDESRMSAAEVVQQEYDLLRRQNIPHLMSVIDLRYFQNHLSIVAAWPSDSQEKENSGQLHTLQNVLQSGIGLPDEQAALSWIDQLCTGLDHLHNQHIFIGDLDPHALILGDTSYIEPPTLMVSWLPQAIRDLLPRSSVIASKTAFSAPEVLLGKAEARSDVYSLGAILYLLLTGTPPSDPTLRMQRRLRSPHELNPRISNDVNRFIVRALSIEPAERFQNVRAMSDALSHLHHSSEGDRSHLSFNLGHLQISQAPLIGGLPKVPPSTDGNARSRLQAVDVAIMNTTVITPVPSDDHTLRQQSDLIIQNPAGLGDQFSPSPTTIGDVVWQEGKIPQQKELRLSQRLRQHITNLLPVGRASQQMMGGRSRALVSSSAAALEPIVEAERKQERSLQSHSLFKYLQYSVLGKQQYTTTAAALIETPLRVQPEQQYATRIQLMGRDQPVVRNGTMPSGLSALTQGELVHIEVRLVSYQSNITLVQQTAVHIQTAGYRAMVIIPIPPIPHGPSGRRDRLQFTFMNEMHQPLYESPFVLELFVSHLVQPGREGYNVLSIPL